MILTRRIPMLVLALASLLLLVACSAISRPSPATAVGPCKTGIDVPLNYRGREMICLTNLERLLDAKQEWARDHGASRGDLVPSPESLAHEYFRKYKYGRRAPCDDETQKYDSYRPICPSGGEYIIGNVGERPKCSIHGDLLRDYDQHIRVPQTH
jgi:hypothetical protein